MKKIMALCILISVFFLVTCNENSNPTGSGTSATTATVTHAGFDFSTGTSSATADGETITWMPGGGTHSAYASGSNVWWRNSHLDTNGLNLTRDMGMVALSSVTSVPATWDTNPAILPLLPDHVIVAKTADGFVKFKVVSTDTTGAWPAVVEFIYSANSSF